jgi:hypothetical protein
MYRICTSGNETYKWFTNCIIINLELLLYVFVVYLMMTF